MAKRIVIRDWADEIVDEVREKEDRYYCDQYYLEDEPRRKSLHEIQAGGFDLYPAYGWAHL